MAALNQNKIALFLPILSGGGAERVMLSLAALFIAQGLEVDLILANATHPQGILRDQVPNGVQVVDLEASGVLKSLPKLIAYLRRERPLALLSSLDHANIIAILARRLSFSGTPVIIRHANMLSLTVQRGSNFFDRHMDKFARIFFRGADRVIAVSQGAAQDLVESIGLPAAKIEVIYNPLLLDRIEALAQTPVEHPFFEQAEPVIIGAGRLTPEKDFPTLIRAFSLLQSKHPARLIILGEGAKRPELEALITELGLQAKVDLLGFTENPYAYMQKSRVFALSSIFEGLPNVLLEAMACGCSVVSTDCPSGPAEILTEPRYGKLVPMRDPAALADAILASLNTPTNPADLRACIERFNPDTIAAQYLAVLRNPKTLRG